MYCNILDSYGLLWFILILPYYTAQSARLFHTIYPYLSILSSIPLFLLFSHSLSYCILSNYFHSFNALIPWLPWFIQCINSNGYSIPYNPSILFIHSMDYSLYSLHSFNGIIFYICIVSAYCIDYTFLY